MIVFLYLYFLVQLTPPLGLDLYMPVPEDNPLTPEKISFGRKLFSDPLLSRTGEISCQSCHDPDLAFADNRTTGQGVMGRTGRRNVPTIINRGYGSAFFLDGRARTLEEQVLKPIQDAAEMDMSLEDLATRLHRKPEYRNVTIDDVARALSCYVRTIMSGDSPVDRFVNGDSNALSDEARRGLQIFRGKGNCVACHLGPNFSDERFHNTGVAWRNNTWQDDGRFGVTSQEVDRGAFKTPTLREIARTAPYMHDGSISTLEEVVEYYDGGARPNPNIDRELRPLRLTQEEKAALAAFLKSLNGTIREGLQ